MANLIWGASRRILDDDGDPHSGGKIYVYTAGTTTAVTTYSDSGLASANAHPVVADANGVVGPIYVASGEYKVRVTDASDVVLYEDDYVKTDASVTDAFPSNRAALQALNTTDYPMAFIRGEDGWKWESGDQSASMVDVTGTTTSIATGTDIATLVNHGLLTGDAFVTTATDDLTVATIYYAIRSTADTFQVASSYANAIAGTAVDLTVTTNFTFQKLTDQVNGIYQPASTATNDDITGVNGAWVRQYSGPVHLAWFPGDAGDDCRRFQAALNVIKMKGGGTLDFSGMDLVMNSRTNTFAGQVLNRPAVAMVGMRDTVVRGPGSTITFGTSVNDTAYLFLAMVTDATANAAGDYSERNTLDLKGVTIQKSRGATNTGTQGTINLSSCKDCTVLDGLIIGSGGNGTDTAISGTNNQNCHIVRLTTLAVTQPFDISLWSRSKIKDGYHDQTGAAAATGTGLPHFYDPVTVGTNYLENAETDDIAYDMEISGNTFTGYASGMALSAIRGGLVHHNVCIGTAANNANTQAGIMVYTDDDLDTATLFTQGVIVQCNECRDYTNAGAGTGVGIRVTTGTGTKDVKDVRVFDNLVFDNDTGIQIETGITNPYFENNDYSRDSGSQTNFATKDNYRGLFSGYITLSDDTAASITPPVTVGKIDAITEAAASNCATWYFNTSTGANGGSVLGSDATLGTSALTGTTGTDVKVNYASVSDGKIYFENRSGQSRTIYYRITKMEAA